MTDLQVKTHAPSPRTPRPAATLLGIGTAVPPPIRQSDAAAIAEEFSCQTDAQRAWLRRVFLRSGVDQRGSVLQNHPGDIDAIRAFYPHASLADPGPSTAIRMDRYAREAPPLLHRAALAALHNAAVPPAEITHLITVSCTGFFAPGLDVQLITRLALRPNVRRLHLGFMGCHAAFNALAAAHDILRGDPDALVLVACVELSTLHFAYGFNPEKLVANALFADGASACVLGRTTPRTSTPHHKPAAPAPTWRLLHSASLLLPDSQDAMTWRIGDHGFEMTLSATLPTLISAHIRPWCDSWLADLGLTIPDIDRWAIHPGGPKILNAARDALGLINNDMAPSFDILARHGNMSSATLLFLLQHLAQPPVPAPPTRCVAIGFGPGLIAEALLLELT